MHKSLYIALVAILYVAVIQVSGYETKNEDQSLEKVERFKRIIRNVEVPGIFDMVKDGSSMGINILSGMVRVDKGQMAERTGLSGPRPLSVRIFGIPVYQRGVRLQEPQVGSSGGSAKPEGDSYLPPSNENEPLADVSLEEMDKIKDKTEKP